MAVLVLFAGCGDDDRPPEGVAPREWARQVCTGLQGWLDGIAQASEPLRDIRTDDLEAARATLVAFLDDLTSRSQALLQAVTEAGTPAVEDGAAMARQFRQAVGEVRDDFARTGERTRALPTGDRPAFQAGLSRIFTDLRNARQRLRGSLDQVEEDYDPPELVEALETEPACARVYRPG